MSDFFQDPARLENTYRSDPALRALLRRLLPEEARRDVEPGLERLGERAACELRLLGDEAEAAPPRHVPFDAWGRRVDRVETSSAWRRLRSIAAEEGVVATAYERRHGADSRLHQMALLYLFHPPSALASCPLAMTDGAARLLELYGAEDLQRRLLPHLLSRQPESFWTSGQWMTEREGGSDVARSSTVARPDGPRYRLSGAKWFTSAVDAEMALALARIEGDPPGNRGLSVFAVETRNAAGELDGIRIERLKDKLGTRALPTAELRLDGVPARLVGRRGEGVRTIAAMLQITRLYNSCCAAAFLRWGLLLAGDYARRRVAFGRPLAELPLHRETLADLEAECQLANQLVFRAAALAGREECGVATAEEHAVLRLLVPVVKLLTGKQAIAGASEILECFGGAGYIEDTGLPRLVRDSQVLPIWEGTTNVLSLDARRAIEKEKALAPFVADLERRLAAGAAIDRAPAEAARRDVERLLAWRRELETAGPEVLEAGARRFAMALGRLYGVALLLEQAGWDAARRIDSGAAEAARRARRGLPFLPAPAELAAPPQMAPAGPIS